MGVVREMRGRRPNWRECARLNDEPGGSGEDEWG